MRTSPLSNGNLSLVARKSFTLDEPASPFTGTPSKKNETGTSRTLDICCNALG
jgi:hypothetical protein